MRRRIELYIAGRKADLDEQGFLLYNYAFTDLELPSVVKNSFSKQVTLPATARNLELFGHPENTQRSTGSSGSATGPDFNAGQKTPFELRDELNEIIESGYIRLDATVVKGRKVTGLNVTLFGGIGSFFYNLGYNSDGSKKTLADLTYGVPLSTFTINLTSVAAAWNRLYTHPQSAGISNVWDVINFAPAYNGLPAGDFSADKGIIAPGSLGMADSVTDGSKTYTTKDGLSLLSLKTPHDEWACKDLRSYLQRPVLSMRAFMEAVCNPANNGGFTVDISAVSADIYVGVWKTLPMISSLGSFETVTGTTTLRSLSFTTYQDILAKFVYNGQVPLGASVSARATVQIGLSLVGEILSPCFSAPFSNAEGTGNKYVIIFAQLVGMAGDTKVAGSQVATFTNYTGDSASTLASRCGYSPSIPASYGSIISPTVGHGYGTSYFLSQATQLLEVHSDAVSEYVLEYKCFVLKTLVVGGEETVHRIDAKSVIGILSSENTEDPEFYGANGAAPQSFTSDVSYTSSQKVRSGAVVSFAQLLASAYSPAEYLLSFCKMHGLVFNYDPGAKKVTIMPRNAWFSGETMDLSGRIDRSKDITILPLAMKSKWYELKGTIVNGALAAEYENKYGVKYAIQRVNTGYDFDAATEDLMKSVVFKKAVTLLDSNAYWNMLTDSGGHLLPSVFLDAGNTYTLWDGEGQGKDFSVPIPDNSVTIAYYNATNKGYDKTYYPKMEFRDAEGKALDGVDVLCRFAGYVSYEKFALTDDTVEMLAMNNGKPCWRLNLQQTAARSIPIFHTYDTFSSSHLAAERSLDYGIPREIDMPGLSISLTTGSLYLRYWKRYLEDLLDKDTKVMKCRVDLCGLQVGPELLRKFYWYEGSLWVLNKITNYSLTTWDTVECEFVQVKDATNYTNGQTL